MLSASQDYIVSNSRMTAEWWIGKDLLGSCCGLIEVLFQQLPKETEENYGKLEVRVTCVLAEIWTKHFWNIHLEHYHYTNLLHAFNISEAVFKMHYDTAIFH